MPDVEAVGWHVEPLGDRDHRLRRAPPDETSRPPTTKGSSSMCQGPSWPVLTRYPGRSPRAIIRRPASSADASIRLGDARRVIHVRRYVRRRHLGCHAPPLTRYRGGSFLWSWGNENPRRARRGFSCVRLAADRLSGPRHRSRTDDPGIRSAGRLVRADRRSRGKGAIRRRCSRWRRRRGSASSRVWS